jgi:hypothetical protein
MARWTTPTDEQLQAYTDWADQRSEPVKAIAKKFDPWTLYRLCNPEDPDDPGHRVTVHGYSEDGTLIVNVTGEFNLIGFGRRVFGVSPDDLTECDLPAADEPVGTTMTEEETLAYINEQRAKFGNPPLSKEGLEEIKASAEPRCAIDFQSQAEGEAGAEGEGEAGAEAVPAQEAGPADDPSPDKT